MLPLERQCAILEQIGRTPVVTVEQLSKKLFVSSSTIRRDLDYLAKNHMITRSHGGAVLLVTSNMDVPLHLREKSQTAAKDIIARAARKLIKDGDTLYLDSSSTVMRLIPLLEDVRSLTVITNGIKTAYELSKIGIKTISTGGLLSNSTTTLTGAVAEWAVNHYYADRMFFSCRAAHPKFGMMESSEEVCAIKNAMLANSEEAYLLCDSSKLEKTAYCKLADWDYVNDMISDIDFSSDPDWQKALYEED